MTSPPLSFPQRLMLRGGRILMAASYTLLIVYGSLVPLTYRPLPLEEAIEQFRHIKHLDINVYGRADLAANFLLYIPIGLLLAWSLAPRGRSVVLCCLAVVLAAATSAAIAVGVEFLQLWYPPRTVSLNDIRAEILGGTIGAIGYLAARALSSHFSFQSLLRRWSVSRAGFVYFAGIMAFSLLPGDIVISAEEFRAKLADGRVVLVPFSEVDVSAFTALRLVLHVASFVPIGYWLAHLFRPVELGQRIHREAAAKALLAGLGVAVLVELVQLAAFSRFSTATAVLTGTLGTTCGVTLQMLAALDDAQRPRWVRRAVQAFAEPGAWRLAALVISAAIVAIMLTPFRLASEDLRQERWQMFRRPLFAAMYISTEFDALTNMLHKGLPFFALGVAMAYSIQPRTTPAAVAQALLMLVYAGLLSGGIEIAQVYFDVHQPDLTDVLVAVMAAAIGVFGVFQVRAQRRRAAVNAVEGRVAWS